MTEGDRARLCPNQITNIGADQCLEVSKLDDEFVRLNLDHVNVIRIDARGFELNVLLGAKMILDRFHPILVIKFSASSLKNHGRTIVEVIQFVKSLGYSCMDLKTSMPLVTSIRSEAEILCYV